MHDSDICGAKTRNDGICQNAPMDNGRCRMHGGASPTGLGSARFKSGKFSRYLPERMLERYDEAQSDAELLGLRDEIALVDARLSDLLGRVDTGESGALWRTAQQLWQDYSQEIVTEKAHEILMTLGETICAGAADYAAWDEVNKQLRQRKQLVESERKRLVELKQVITNEQAMVLIANLTDIIRRHVTDRTVLTAISADLVRLTGGSVGRIPDTTG